MKQTIFSRNRSENETREMKGDNSAEKYTSLLKELETNAKKGNKSEVAKIKKQIWFKNPSLYYEARIILEKHNMARERQAEKLTPKLNKSSKGNFNVIFLNNKEKIVKATTWFATQEEAINAAISEFRIKKEDIK